MGIAHPLSETPGDQRKLRCQNLQLFVLGLITLNPDSSPLRSNEEQNITTFSQCLLV